MKQQFKLFLGGHVTPFAKLSHIQIQQRDSNVFEFKLSVKEKA